MDYFKISKNLLFLSALMVVVVTTSTLFPFIVGKYVFFRFVVWGALLFFSLGMVLQEQKSKEIFESVRKIIRRPIVLAVTAFVASFLLAGFFGVDPAFSFWSNFERGEGGLQMLTFFVYFLLLITLFDKKEDWKKMFWWVLGGGILMALYGFFAGVGVRGFVGPTIGTPGYRLEGSIGNSSYVAIFSMYMIFFAAQLFLETQKKNVRIFLGVCTSVFLAAFIFAATRGAFVGLAVTLFVFLVYLGLSYKKWRKKLFLIAGIGACVFVLLVVFRNTPAISSLPFARVFDISLSAQTFEHRTIMWNVAWDGFKEKPLLGWGPENFLTVFNTHFNTAYFNPAEGFGAWFDRAHSIIFDYLSETGIIGFLTFCSMFLALFWTVIKNHLRTQKERFSETVRRALFLAFPIGYLVQGLVLFDVSVTYINIFLLLAYAVFLFKNDEKKVVKNEKIS